MRKNVPANKPRSLDVSELRAATGGNRHAEREAADTSVTCGVTTDTVPMPGGSFHISTVVCNGGAVSTTITWVPA